MKQVFNEIEFLVNKEINLKITRPTPIILYNAVTAMEDQCDFYLLTFEVDVECRNKYTKKYVGKATLKK